VTEFDGVESEIEDLLNDLRAVAVTGSVPVGGKGKHGKKIS
jgi:hypothetical protein